MSVVNVTLGDGKKLNLPLGRQGENEVTAVVFDFSAWSTEFGSGTLSLSVQRHGDELPYAVTMTTSGTNATWTISDLDTAYKGTGEAQVKYTVGTKVKKSAVYKFTVNKSLGQNGEYPSPGQTWQEEIEDELDDVKQDLGDLSELETEAKSDLVSAINEANQHGGSGSGLTEEIKNALMACMTHLTWENEEDGDTYGEALRNALWPPTPATSITLNQNSLSFTGLNTTQQLTATVLPQDTTDTVTWSSSDPTIATVSDNGLVTSKDYGTCTISATAGSRTATCSVVVAQAILSSISAVYTQGGTVYDTDSLDSLKTDLVVTAHWSDSSDTTVASSDYTLSGTLTAGTSTVTVSYGGKTTTFAVTVTHDMTYTETLLASLVPGTDFTYDVGTITPSDGSFTSNTGYYLSDWITIPDGTTSFAFGLSKLDTNDGIAWYDEEKNYVGAGFGSGTYSGNSTYGDGYTDSDSIIWHAVPSNAKYMRIHWKDTYTLSYIKFKHNCKLDESVTPEVGKVYYYTYSTSSTTANTEDYLPCEGMAYAHSRPVYRRGGAFYDAEKIAVQTITVANNIGNNITIPSTAKYFRPGNTTNNSTSWSSLPTRNGIGLIEFTDESKSSW